MSLSVCVFLFGSLLVGLQSGKDHDVQHRHFISHTFNDKVGMRNAQAVAIAPHRGGKAQWL